METQITNSTSALDRLIVSLAESVPSAGFSTGQEFNQFCKNCIRRFNALGERVEGGGQFGQHRTRISTNQGQVISTPWGGVDIRLRDEPRVEKYLVVDRGHYLAYEKHSKKEEWMEGREGIGLLLLAPTPGARPQLHALVPGRTIAIAPNHEHCLIALTDLLVFERSLDHLGMDKDLIFLFTPDTSPT